MTVIPTINCPDWECLDGKLRIANEHLRAAGWLHLDIADGRFTFGKSWSDPAAWARHNKHFQTEVHLMVEEPEKAAEEWLKAGAKRLIIHLESMRAPDVSIPHILLLCQAHGAQLMLAINAETPIETLEPYLRKTSYFQIFAQAYPGPPGQKFLPAVLPKIRRLRALAPDATIEVDGGMEPSTIRQVKEAGADTVISGSYILNNPDPAAAYAELTAI